MIDQEAMKQSGRDGVGPQGAFRTFYQRIDLSGDYAVGQDVIISGGSRLKDGLSMTFELTWRFCSRPSSGGVQIST
jgi:hypothetical protein